MGLRPWLLSSPKLGSTSNPGCIVVLAKEPLGSTWGKENAPCMFAYASESSCVGNVPAIGCGRGSWFVAELGRGNEVASALPAPDEPLALLLEAPPVVVPVLVVEEMWGDSDRYDERVADDDVDTVVDEDEDQAHPLGGGIL
eukprot:jgi/Mesvir1/21231/Mv06667-RA.1